MSDSLKLSAELERILVKRIAAKLNQAKYYPGTMLDVEAAAEEVVRPYVVRERTDPEYLQIGSEHLSKD